MVARDFVNGRGPLAQSGNGRDSAISAYRYEAHPCRSDYHSDNRLEYHSDFIRQLDYVLRIRVTISRVRPKTLLSCGIDVLLLK